MRRLTVLSQQTSRVGREAEQHAQRMWEISHDLFCVSAGDVLLSVNQAWERTLGWTQAELVGQHAADFMHPEDLPRTREAAGGGDLVRFENRYRCKDGSYRWLLWSGYRDGDRWYGVAKDVTPIVEAREILETSHEDAHLVTWEWDPETDEMWLTAGMREEFGVRPEQVGTLADGLAFVEPDEREYALGQLRALVAGDIDIADYVLRINVPGQGVVYVQTWARAFRDEAQRVVHVRGTSQDITDRHRLETAQSAITNSMGEGLIEIDADGRAIYVNPAASALLGWTAAELAGREVHAEVHEQLTGSLPGGIPVRVDDDVFTRRDGGSLPVSFTMAPTSSGTVVVFTDISERKAYEVRIREDSEALRWVSRIRRSLDHGRFVLHEQPIIELASQATVGHELLLRMLDQDGAPILPGNFLPTAERFGLIGEIDRWVLHQGAARAAHDPGHVAVNVSAESLSNPSLIDDLEAALAAGGGPPERLIIELTETAILRDEAAALRFIERAGALGCRLALDDFGTGYGSLAYLKRMPFHFLKIDREFVADLLSDPASVHVVQAVVSLAKAFGQQTVAEGVEDRGALALLTELGVDHAQGYALGRPGPTRLPL